MDKLIEFLTSKIGYTVAVILGFLIPGMMFIFVWAQELYKELDILKLLFLAFGISFLLFIPTFIICTSILMLSEKIWKKEIGLTQLVFLPIAMNVLWMFVLMTIKLLNNKYTIVDAINEFGVPILDAEIILISLDCIIGVIKKIKKK